MTWPANWSDCDWPAAWSEEDRARATKALAAAPRPAVAPAARIPNTPEGWPQKKIREAFVNYFKSQKHTHWPSSSVVPHEDPTLLFANAGMNQYKSIFLGALSRVLWARVSTPFLWRRVITPLTYLLRLETWREKPTT